MVDKKGCVCTYTTARVCTGVWLMWMFLFHLELESPAGDVGQPSQGGDERMDIEFACFLKVSTTHTL